MGSVIEWDDTLELAASKAHKAKKKNVSVKAKAQVSVSAPKLTAKPKAQSKPKTRKAKRKERRKKILRGVGAVATGGVSLAVSKKAPKALRKIGKGLAVVATGGAAGAVMVAKKVAKKRKAVKAAKKVAAARSGLPPRSSAKVRPPVVRAAVTPVRAQAKAKLRNIAKAAKFVAPLAPHLKSATVAYEPKLPAAEVLGKPLAETLPSDRAEKFANSLQTLAARVDKAACDAVQTAKSKARDKRSRLKLQLFTKLKHLTSKLPVTHPTRLGANGQIVLHCRQMG